MQGDSRVRLTVALLALALSLTATEGGAAQAGVSVRQSQPDVRQFPVIHTYVSVTDDTGQRIPGLSAASFQVLEDEAVFVSPQVREVLLGTRLVFAVNSTSGMALRDPFGRTRLELVKQALLEWWQAPGAGTLGIDDLTLVTGDGVLAAHADAAAELAARLDRFEPVSSSPTMDLDLVLEALTFLSDAAPRPGMPGYLIFLTPMLEQGRELSLVNAIARANELDATIIPVLVAPAEAALSPQASALQQLAQGTGGSLLVFDPASGLLSLAERLVDQRLQYQVSYTSGVNLSGTHSVRVRVSTEAAEATTGAREYDVAIDPPEAVFVDPPARIERRSDDPTVSLEALPPTSLSLQLMVTFPDGHPRPLAGSELIVDGQVVVQRVEPPFDVLEWDLRSFQTSGSHRIRAVVNDSLGLEGVTAELAVRLSIVEPPRGLAALRNAFGPLLAALAILAAGMAVAVGLSGRSRAQPAVDGAASGGLGRRSPLRRAGLQPRPTAEQAEAFLLPIDPEGGPVEPYPLTGAEVIVGRDPSLCTLALDDASLAGMHARLIRLADGGYQIRDLGSIAGSRVNFQPARAEGQRLVHGDRIDFGRSSFRFQLSNPPPPARVIVRPIPAPRPGYSPMPEPPARRPRRGRSQHQESTRDPNG